MKIGDRVKIIGKIVPSYWSNKWIEEMDLAIGQEGVLHIEEYDGWEIKFDNDPEGEIYGGFTYPEDSIEIINEA